MVKGIGKNTLSYIMAISLYILVIYKGITLSMTHDESASFYYLNHINVIGYLFDANVWPNANNHWLNTLGFQLATFLFGPKEWAIRLPNIIAFGVYAWYSIKLLNDVETYSIRLLGLTILLANPYVLDFFSMARGYGLSLAFTTGALFYASQYLHKENLKGILIVSLLLLLATLSLFSSLIYFPALLGPVLLYVYYRSNFKINDRLFIKSLSIIGVSTTITLLLTYIPLKALSGNEEFKWGATTLMECFKSLTIHSSYSNNQIPNDYFIVGILFCFMVYGLIKSLPLFKSLESIKNNRILLVTITTFIFLILGMIVARYTVGTYYPIDRKTIMFVPFIGIITAYTLDGIHFPYRNLVGWLATSLVIAHFLYSFDKHQVREWWYDNDTKEFINQISQDAGTNSIIVGCNWLFHPTLSFYAKTKYSPQVKIMPYSKDIQIDQDFDYYMCMSSDFDQLKDKYDLLYSNPSGKMILKRKK